VPQLVIIGYDSALPTVIAAPGTTNETAALELADYLSRITGQLISVAETPPEAGVIFHVGPTKLVQKQVDLQKIYADGFVIKHLSLEKRNYVILAGQTEHASQWAVERFLKDYGGVRWLFPDPVYGEHVPASSTVTIPLGTDVTHEPDYTDRGNLSMYYFNSGEDQLRGAPNSSNQYGVHALAYIFGESEFAAHPEWFAEFDGERQWWSYGNGWQICTANTETIAYAIDHCISLFTEYPELGICSIGQNDGSGHCTDDLCTAQMHAADPAYSQSELWWLWVNEVAAGVAAYEGGVFADRWVEAMSYDWSSELPRFALEPNVAITKTIVLGSDLDAAEAWLEPPTSAASVNLYSYPWGNAFLGFRHYPTAMADFLKWGRNTLNANGHVAECGPGDWTFDGPKYYYTQALQWDVNADPQLLMEEFCDASYGSASEEMFAFWQRLEDVWEARDASTTYGEEPRMLFYQWIGWATDSYVPPNDELRTYTLADIEELDARIASSLLLVKEDSEVVQYRVERMVEAWRYYRTYLWSKIQYLDQNPDTVVDSKKSYDAMTALAEEIAQLRADREHYKSLMASHPKINARMADAFHSNIGWLEGYTFLSFEQGLLDQVCSAISAYIVETDGEGAVIAHWEAVAEDDPLYMYAQSQRYILTTQPLNNLIFNGGFEGLSGWESSGTISLSNEAYEGGRALKMGAGQVSVSQTVSVSQLERYRLTAWGRYLDEPDAVYVPTELTVAYHDIGGNQLWNVDPTRTMFRSFSAADGWTQVSSTLTVPYTADTATITLKKMHDVEMLLDSVSFERILPGPDVTDGILYDPFDGPEIDLTTWFSATGGVGTDEPKVEDGWLVYDDEAMFAINSLASFDELIDRTGKDRFHLRLHIKSLKAANPGSAQSFGIKTGPGPLSISDSGFMFYHYFDSGDADQRGMITAYNYEDGVNTNTEVFYLPTVSPVTEVWYTLYFDPTEVTIYAADDGYREDAGAFVAQYEHGISDLGVNGPVYFKIEKAYAGGFFAIDQVSLD
jgi:hypothetical protein